MGHLLLKQPYPVLASRVDWGVDTPSPMIRLIFFFSLLPPSAPPPPAPPPPPCPLQTGEAPTDRRESIEQVSAALPVLGLIFGERRWLRGSDF